MKLIIFSVASVIGLFNTLVHKIEAFGSPYNIYGDQGSQHYPEALITYGPLQQRPLTQTASQRGNFYPPPQHKSYGPVRPGAYTPEQRAYTLTQQRLRNTGQTRANPYVQPRAYNSPRTRAYPPFRTQSYARPQAYTPISPHPANIQSSTYAHPAMASAYGQRTSPPYFIPAKQTVLKPAARQPLRTTVRQPISNQIKQPLRAAANQPISAGLMQSMKQVQPISTIVRQPITNVQTPLTRSLVQKFPTFQSHQSLQFPQSFITQAQVPLGLGTYGRDHIPQTPAARSNLLDRTNPEKITIQSQHKRNNIALTYPQTSESRQVSRNHINGNMIPQQLARKESPFKPKTNAIVEKTQHLTIPIRPDISPIKPQAPQSTPTKPKLSSFLRNVNKLQDTLEGNTMRQDLIYYDDDVSNKSRHRPTNFASPTRKLGSLGSPGGSLVTFRAEPATRPAIIPETKAVNQAGSQRVTIAQTDTNITSNATKPTKMSNQKNDTNYQNAQTLPYENMTRPEKSLTNNTVNAETSLAVNTTNEIKPSVENNTDATGSYTVNNTGLNQPPAAAQVDLGLLKDKVLHSNNSHFLKRVLQVLKKYTKLMKTSMTGKNGSTMQDKTSERNDLNSSIEKGETQTKNTTEGTIFQNMSGIRLTNMGNDSDVANALNSTKTAVKIFDYLNNASRKDLNSSLEKEMNGDPKTKNSTLQTGNLLKSESEATVTDYEAKQRLKDENASKKQIIEHEKPVFNIEKLKYGLERGNTID